MTNDTPSAPLADGTDQPVVGIPDPDWTPKRTRWSKRRTRWASWRSLCVDLLELPDERKQLRKWYDRGHSPLAVYEAHRWAKSAAAKRDGKSCSCHARMAGECVCGAWDANTGAVRTDGPPRDSGTYHPLVGHSGSGGE